MVNTRVISIAHRLRTKKTQTQFSYIKGSFITLTNSLEVYILEGWNIVKLVDSASIMGMVLW